MQTGILKHVVTAAVIAVVLYAVAYWAIEHRRTRNGPWELVFGSNERGDLAVRVNQPRLGIRGAEVAIEGPKLATNVPRQMIRFEKPQPVPFDLPFGRCVYMDLTFLPGVVTCDFFGHVVEFMPRTLVVDKEEIAWTSNMMVKLSGSATNRTFNPQRSMPNGR